MANQKYEAFVTAAKTGSFKAAAAELGYTQAGISYMMNALEQEMGTALFARDHAGVRLTADGQNLLPWIKDVCASERALQTRLDEIRNVEAGSLSIAAFASIAIHWLPDIMDSFLREHPNVHYDLSCFEDQGEMEEAAWRGDFDCCFLILPARLNYFSVPLAQDPLYIVVSPDHPMANAPFFPTQAMLDEPYIKIRNDSYTELDAVFSRHGVKPEPRFVMENDYAVMGMVSKGWGYSLFPKLMLENAPFELARLEPEMPAHRELGLAVKSYEKASVATKAFIACVQDWARREGLTESLDPTSASPSPTPECAG